MGKLENYIADLIAKNDSSIFSNTQIALSLCPLEKLIRKLSKWHWVKTSGQLLLEISPLALQNFTHLQYMMDSDDFRASRDLPIKWQYAKLGHIHDLWKPEKSNSKKRTYGHRPKYDKGRHGGNRSKAPVYSLSDFNTQKWQLSEQPHRIKYLMSYLSYADLQWKWNLSCD